MKFLEYFHCVIFKYFSSLLSLQSLNVTGDGVWCIPKYNYISSWQKIFSSSSWYSFHSLLRDGLSVDAPKASVSPHDSIIHAKNVFSTVWNISYMHMYVLHIIIQLEYSFENILFHSSFFCQPREGISTIMNIIVILSIESI